MAAHTKRRPRPALSRWFRSQHLPNWTIWRRLAIVPRQPNGVSDLATARRRGYHGPVGTYIDSGSDRPRQAISSGYAMVSVNFKLAILTVLANWPDRRATIDEIREEVGIIFANGGHADSLKRLSALGDIDIFQTGLVSRNREGFQITDAGLLLLQSLESSNGPSAEVSTASASQPLGLIDDLIGTEERDLERRTLDDIPPDGNEHNSRQPAQDEGNRAVAIEASGSASLAGADRLPESIDTEADAGDDDDRPFQGEQGQAVSIEAPRAASPSFPASRGSFGSKRQNSGQKSLQLASLLAFIAAKGKSVAGAWRRLFLETASNEKPERFVGSAGGVAFAIFSLILVIACVLAVIAFGQIQSLKSDVAALRREVLPVRERIARLEQIEKAKRELDQETQNKSDTEKNQPGEVRADQAALNLSREEIQLIRNYIKPAPSAGAAAPAINVGDTVSGAMIPLPPQLTEKIPRLLGGKFAIRSGAIIIIKKDSRQADAVLTPN
jgi:hypothetical protein